MNTDQSQLRGIEQWLTILTDDSLLTLANSVTLSSPFIGVALAVAGLAGCAFCGGFETGVYSVNRVRLAVRASRGDAAARALREELLHPNRLLATCLLGNNLSHNVLTFGVAALLVPYSLSESSEVAVNTLIVLPVVLLLGEVLPKELFRASSNSWTYLAVRPFRLLRGALTWCGLVPVTHAVGDAAEWILGLGRAPQATARQRISQLLQEGAGVGLLSDEQMALADRALALAGRKVETQMVPWKRAVTVLEHADSANIRKLLAESSHSRFPVVAADGSVIGVLEARDALVSPEQLPKALARPALLILQDTPITKVLLRMRIERTAMAIIVDDRGLPLGFATLRDLLQPLLGRLPGW